MVNGYVEPGHYGSVYPLIRREAMSNIRQRYVSIHHHTLRDLTVSVVEAVEVGAARELGYIQRNVVRTGGESAVGEDPNAAA